MRKNFDKLYFVVFLEDEPEDIVFDSIIYVINSTIAVWNATADINQSQNGYCAVKVLQQKSDIELFLETFRVENADGEILTKAFC